MTLFEIFVPGVPQPAGSKNSIPVFNRHTGQYVTAANGRPVVSTVDACKKSRPWKSHISAMVANAWTNAPLDEALELSIVFVMPRPNYHYGHAKGARVLKKCAPHFHTTKPDSSKLFRAAEDALTGVLYVDDARVAKHHAVKIYGDRPGAHIRIARAIAPAQENTTNSL